MHSVPGKWSSILWAVRALFCNRARRSSFCRRDRPSLDGSRATPEEKGLGKSQQRSRPSWVQASVTAAVTRKEHVLDTRATENQPAFKKVGDSGKLEISGKKEMLQVCALCYYAEEVGTYKV